MKRFRVKHKTAASQIILPEAATLGDGLNKKVKKSTAKLDSANTRNPPTDLYPLQMPEYLSRPIVK